MENKIQKLITEYISCSEICEQTNYSNNSSVNKHNQTVERMYEIVTEINLLGDAAINKLAKLLSHSISSKWLSHHLIEKANISGILKEKCINIIKQLAKDESANGLGEKMWLEERGINI